MTAELRAHGLRATAQRRAILAAFPRAERAHLSADQVLDRARAQRSDLSRATVYNALGEFVAAGVLRSLEGFGSLRYERERADGHHHLHCRRCGSIVDVAPAGVDRLIVDAAIEIDEVRIVFHGTCADCLAADLP